MPSVVSLEPARGFGQLSPVQAAQGDAQKRSDSRKAEKRILVFYLVGIGFLIFSYLVPLPFSLLPLAAAVILFLRGWQLSRRLRRRQSIGDTTVA